MVDNLVGRWKLARSENVEEYMKATNVNFVLRKLAKTLSYQLEIAQTDGGYIIIFTSTFKNKTTPFKLDETFEDIDLSGKKYNVMFYIEDGRLKSRRDPIEPQDPSFLNEFFINDENELVNVSTITSVDPHVSSTRILQRI